MCPDENDLLRFARGEAGADQVALEAHLDGCESCRKAIAAAASETTLPAQSVTHQLTPGQRVNRYEIERELGRGGMGIVYQARDVTLDRRVALKLLHARTDEGAQARLLREAQVMAKLAHPNVVPVFELGEWNREVYLVMELVSGVTLEAWLKREKHRAREVLEKFVAAGRGLAAAHAAGVVHRDFKPANVLVGGDDRVRVTDFGLSRPGPSLELPATDSAYVTRDGAVVGTLAYMAPEQLDGKLADERSDQFSFCVALAEALAGVRPFEGETWAQLSQRLMGPPRLAGVPRSLKPVLTRGLAKDPARRFASMTALLNAIEHAQRLGWRSVVGTGALAAAAVALLSVGPFALRSYEARQQQATAAADAEAMVPVVQAARDLPEGTVVQMEDLMQRTMPSRYVTTSIVKPDSASYILGQKLLVAVQAGDALLWTQFATSKQSGKVQVLGAVRDLEEGTVLSDEVLAPLDFAAENVTTSFVTPENAKYVLGQRLGVPLQKGDALLWSQVLVGSTDKTVRVATLTREVRAGEVLEPGMFETRDLPLTKFEVGMVLPPVLDHYLGRAALHALHKKAVLLKSDVGAEALPALEQASILETLASAKDALLRCKDNSHGKYVLGFDVDPGGAAVNVRLVDRTSADGTPMTAGPCLVDAVKALHFPPSTEGRSSVTFPFVF